MLAHATLALASSVWLLLILDAAIAGLNACAAIAATAAAAMVIGAWLGAESHATDRVAMFDGFAAGAMLAAAVCYLLPGALHGQPAQGLIGIGLGVATGLALRFGVPRPQGEPMLGALTLHALAAGIVLGMLGGRAPGLDAALAVALVAHKLPAGYVLARQLQRSGRSRLFVAWPALAVGLAALPVALWLPPLQRPADGALLGFATGLFVFVAVTFCNDLRRHRSGAWLYTVVLAGILIGGLALVGGTPG